MHIGIETRVMTSFEFLRNFIYIQKQGPITILGHINMVLNK